MKPLKAYLNFLLYRVNRELRRPVIDNYPVVAFVDPTTFCNLRCPACPTGARAGLRPQATLDWDLYRAFMEEVGDYLFKLYLYNLGEPLLHKKAPELVELARARDIFVMVSSNLSFPLSDDYCERLVRSGLDVLVVPLDGTTPETYQTYRQQGCFELVRENMRKVQATKQRLDSLTPRVVWQFLVFRHNEHEVDTVRREYRAWGADEYCIGGAYLPLSGGLAPSSMAQYDIYDPGHLHRRMTLQAMAEAKACTWLYGVSVLNASGKLSPCCYTAAEKDDFGDYAPGEFMRSWNAERFTRARTLTGNWQANESWDAIGRRMNGRGMGVAAALAPGQLVCERCPVPFLQDVVDHELSFGVDELVRHIQASPELTPEGTKLLDYLLSQMAR
ncbi:MAG: radical SAM/SPASM domain-containing protein [Candidatus Eremiobacterota bacterium]